MPHSTPSTNNASGRHTPERSPLGIVVCRWLLIIGVLTSVCLATHTVIARLGLCLGLMLAVLHLLMHCPTKPTTPKTPPKPNTHRTRRPRRHFEDDPFASVHNDPTHPAHPLYWTTGPGSLIHHTQPFD